MAKSEFICINCPLGCMLTVEYEGRNIISVTGNTCPRGDKYARQELLDPKRTVTSSVRTENSTHRRLSVKTVPEIPKDEIFSVMEEVKKTVVSPPVRIGDVIIHDIAGTGSDLVATGNLSE